MIVDILQIYSQTKNLGWDELIKMLITYPLFVKYNICILYPSCHWVFISTLQGKLPYRYLSFIASKKPRLGEAS